MSSARRAAFVAIGSELLRAQRLETNSLLAARLLAGCGFALVEKRAIEDDEAAIAAAVGELASRAELVVVSGGLGPTADDVTREGVARAFGRRIERRAALAAAIEDRYRASGRTVPAIAARMADVIEGAEVLSNPQGTAPGLALRVAGCLVVLLPGVPRELETILATHVLPLLGGEQPIAVRTLHLAGVYESQVEERVSHLYGRYGRESVTILAGRGLVDLVLTAAGADAGKVVAAMDRDFAAAAGDDLLGRDADTLAAVVLDGLRRRGWRLAIAESCTGGMLGALLTAVPGASDVFVGGVVAYANDVKSRLLGVGDALLAERGAVSDEVASAMADGACALGAECSVAITGVAGPGGGSAEKPVGTVHIAVRTPAGRRRLGRRLPGDRAMVRELAATLALDQLRRALAEA